MDGMGTSNIHGSGSGAAAEAAAVAAPAGGAGGMMPAGQGSDNAGATAPPAGTTGLGAAGALAGAAGAATGQVAEVAARAAHAVAGLVSGVVGGSASEAAALPRLRVLLAGPRGFCAGVDRAIRVVEEAIRTYGAPVYVRHEIVHNRTVVEQLEQQGAVFVEELDEVPANAHVVFSAHGVPKSVPAEAQRRNLAYLDATCPLVSKVHREAERHFAGGGAEQRHILMIGHAGHPEVVGTMGQLPPGAVTLVQDAGEARVVEPADPSMLAFITQTTLSVDDTAEIVEVLRTRFPLIEGPKREDICYATTNRQQAVKAVAPGCDLVIVIGSPNSSNSQRLREVAERAGAGRAVLVPRVREMDWSILDGVSTLGITAGASAPEALVQEMLAALAGRWTLEIEERRVVEEHVTFRLPAPLA